MVLIIYILFSFIFFKKKKGIEEISSYECGFDLNCDVRLVFSYRFFLISILFIIFDVEISLILPIPFVIGRILNVFVFYLFVFVLIIGLLYEYNYGSLDWLEVHN